MNKRVYFILLLGIAFSCKQSVKMETAIKKERGPVTLVIHGGAGTIRKGDMTPESEIAYRNELSRSLEAGYAILENGGTSIEAVITSIKILENSPLFNAGKGAVFTYEGKNELDASIMDGRDLSAGAVAGITRVKNPIVAAFTVMRKSTHVMLAGDGADSFAEKEGLEMVNPSYFFDSTRYKNWQKTHENARTKNENAIAPDKKFGTVGAVALDRFGNLAAGTSTGGMMNKRYGRIGDSPIIGAGTYADNNTCAVSATGYGEYFIRLSIAKDITALMEYGGLSIHEAADSVIMKKLPKLGGDGGVIALDRHGNFTMTFCTAGMYRGFIQRKGQPEVFIYKNE